MILEREQWHLGYASLLRECRGTSQAQQDGAPDSNYNVGIPSMTSTSQVGRALLLVHPDTDAMATARILSYMLRADGVPYQMRPCLGWERLKHVLGKVGVLPPPPPSSNNDNNDGTLNKHNEQLVEDYNGTNYIENETDIRAVVLMNMGANRNLSKLFRQINNNHGGASQLLSTQDSFGISGPYNNESSVGRNNIKCYVFDCHRPYHLSNIHAGKNVVLFNDRPFDDDEIPSDGDNLSGDESSSSEDESESDDDSDSDGDENNEGRKGESDDSEGEQEFELEDDEEGEGERGAKRQKKTRFEDDEIIDPADDEADGDEQQPSSSSSGDRVSRAGRDDDDDDGLQDSDDDDEDDYGANKKVNNEQNPLDTTAATVDETMLLDETLDQSQTQDDDQLEGTTTATTETSSAPVTTFRELHRQRRNRIRLHYSSGSYHGSPSAWTAYTLCRQLRFGDTPDLLWLACVGVTDAYLHGRLDVAGYGALTVDLKRHVGRLFPNELVDRVGRAVYAEELEAESASVNDNGSGRAWTQIGLSENGRILSQNEYKFMLLRHTSLWDSLLHSNFVASKLQVWKSSGRQRLMELLAKMGFPLDQCRQPWAFVGPNMKRRLGERMEDVSEVRVIS